MKPIDWVVYVFQVLALVMAAAAAAFAFIAGNVATGIVWTIVAVLWAVNIGLRAWARVKNKK